MHYCDNLLHMNGSDTNNTQVDANILSRGADGVDAAAANFTGSPSFLHQVVSDDFASQVPDAYFVRGDNFWLPTNNIRSYRFDHSFSGFNFTWDLSTNNHPKMVAYGLLKLGPANDGPSVGLYDLVRIDAVNGPAVICQLDIGVNQAGYNLVIECASSSTRHSAAQVVTPGNAYWICMLADYSKKTTDNSTAKMAIYNFPSLTAVNLTLAADSLAGSDTSPDTVGNIEFGQSEAGVSAGTFSYFKGWALDFNDMTFPIPPIESGVKYPNSGIRPRGFAPGIAR